MNLSNTSTIYVEIHVLWPNDFKESWNESFLLEKEISTFHLKYMQTCS
jgi:hypothetical protein